MTPRTRILIVAGDAPTRQATERLLADDGIDVVVAADGASGLRLAAEQHPALVLLDLDLPDIPGRELLRGLRADPALAAVAVVLCSTGPVGVEQQVLDLDAGADGHLVRPIVARELRARVRAHLRRHAAATALRVEPADGGGTLAGGTAHDLNNLLVPILMSVNLLRSPGDNPERTRLLDIIESSARRGAGLVSRVSPTAGRADGETPPEEPAMAPAPAVRGQGELLLVVDDEAAIREVTRQTLEAAGYRVLLAADGAEAIAHYAGRGAEIAAVLTDMRMPVMDGPATIEVLRRLNPHVRIIAVSGAMDSGRPADATSAGVPHTLAKPFTGDALLRAIRRVLDD